MIGYSNGKLLVLKINNNTYLFLSNDGYGRKNGMLYAFKAINKIVCNNLKVRYESLLNSRKRGLYVQMAEKIEKEYLSEIIALEDL